jgi:hypothetical protein
MKHYEEKHVHGDHKICVECGSEIIELHESIIYECDHCLRNADE